MDCERADLLVGLLGAEDDPADAALTPAERAEAEAHVAGCPACREALAAYRALSGALRSLPSGAGEAPSAEATARAYAAVVEAMGAAQPSARGGVRVLEGGRATGERSRRTHPTDDRQARRRPAMWLQGLAAAACVLLVVTLAFRADDPSASVSRAPRAPLDEAAPSAAEPTAPPAAEPPAPAAPRQAAPQEQKSRDPLADQADQEAAAAGAPAPEPRREFAAERELDEATSRRRSAGSEDDAAALQAPPAPPASPSRSAPSAPTAAAEAQAASDPDADAAVDPAADEDAVALSSHGEPAAAEQGVVAAWRVGDRLVVLERVGDDVVAREGELRGEAELARPQRAADVRGGAGAPRAGPSGAAAEPVAQVDPAEVAPRRVAAAGRAPDLERELLTILAAELQRPRDPTWTTRVELLLRALDVRVARHAGADELDALARRVLAAPADDAAPAGR